MTKLLDIPVTATAIPKLPAFLKTLSVSATEPVVITEKSRRVEALILRIQSKTERAIQQLTVFCDTLDDVENRTNDIRRDFDRIRPSKHDVEKKNATNWTKSFTLTSKRDFTG